MITEGQTIRATSNDGTDMGYAEIISVERYSDPLGVFPNLRWKIKYVLDVTYQLSSGPQRRRTTHVVTVPNLDRLGNDHDELLKLGSRFDYLTHLDR